MAFTNEDEVPVEDAETRATTTPAELYARLDDVGFVSSGGSRSSSAEASSNAASQQERQQEQKVAGRADPNTHYANNGIREPPAPRRLLRRQQGSSDLWQNRGSFQTNRKRMQDMFREFSEELGSPENAGKTKAEIEDIFSYTSVGHKHIIRNVPSEDRIAIHQAVVPTIDDKDRKDLEIDSIDATPFAMFGVFDGHGGPACAEFLTQSVSTVLAHSPVLYDEDLTPTQRRTLATADSFEELEKVHNTWADEIGDLSGSTAILSTFQDGVLVMAGVGDSAGLYVDHMGKQHNLCPQHSTSNAKEVERVLSMGGTIVNNRVAGCLMPTRTIGDLDCKRALGAIVSPHPEITLAAIYAPPDDGEPHDEPFLVLASDGLWDVLSFAEVAFITRTGLRNLRAHEKQERAKAEKAAAKAAQAAAAADGHGGGGGRSTGGKKRLWKKMTSSRKERGGGGGSSSGAGGGGGSSLSSSSTSAAAKSSANSSFPGTSTLPRPPGLDGSRTAAWMDGSRRSLDVSRAGLRDSSVRGLDASVRGGQSPIFA
ncbi:unnamed protein product [Ectocarpus sp. 12 AP-2014]